MTLVVYRSSIIVCYCDFGSRYRLLRMSCKSLAREGDATLHQGKTKTGKTENVKVDFAIRSSCSRSIDCQNENWHVPAAALLGILCLCNSNEHAEHGDCSLSIIMQHAQVTRWWCRRPVRTATARSFPAFYRWLRAPPDLEHGCCWTVSAANSQSDRRL